MNIADAIETATKPWWLRLLPYALAVGAVMAALWAAYSFGCDVTSEHYQRVIAQHDADNSKLLLEAQGKLRAQERRHIADMTSIDQQHQEAMQNEITSRDRTIADLRTGAVRLRDKFTTCQRATAGTAGAAGASTGKCDAAASIELQKADAEFLIGLASDADQVADQLRACQGVVRKDRGQ
jgi:hypothetical protein